MKDYIPDITERRDYTSERLEELYLAMDEGEASEYEVDIDDYIE